MSYLASELDVGYLLGEVQIREVDLGVKGRVRVKGLELGLGLVGEVHQRTQHVTARAPLEASCLG
eukprot:scaffold36535_cov62-Phaeocystis_antarctica.AAC.2